MNNTIEIINALLLLSEQCKRTAKLLSANPLSELTPETELFKLPNSSKAIDIQEFELWPEAIQHNGHCSLVLSKLQAHDIGYNFSNASIIEYSNGPSVPIGYMFNNTQVELICNSYKFGSDNQPENVKIIGSFDEAVGPYDVGIIYESLEFDENPVLTLLKMKRLIKPHGKMFIRFRPWSSRDGGFQSNHFNKAFAHLLMDLESDVKSKVVRPIAKYESFLNAAKLRILGRRIKSTHPDDYITTNKEFMDVLISRTWGSIGIHEAVKIMSTTAVDFLVSIC